MNTDQIDWARCKRDIAHIHRLAAARQHHYNELEYYHTIVLFRHQVRLYANVNGSYSRYCTQTHAHTHGWITLIRVRTYTRPIDIHRRLIYDDDGKRRRRRRRHGRYFWVEKFVSQWRLSDVYMKYERLGAWVCECIAWVSVWVFMSVSVSVWMRHMCLGCV